MRFYNMTERTCKYHPDIAARWHCDQCQHDLCINCAREGEYQRKVCPKCGSILQPIKAQSFITPFWLNGLNFLLYPLQGSAVFFVVIWALLFTIIQFGGIMAIPATIILTFIFIRYAFEILTSTSQGKLKSPFVTIDMYLSGSKDVFLLIAFFMSLIFIERAIENNVGPAGYYLYLTFLFFTLPIIMITLVLTRDIFNSLNPLHLINVISKIGAPYLLLLGMLFVIMITYALLAIFAGHFLAGFIGELLYFYTLILVFHIMGYVVLQYHDEMGYAVNIEHITNASDEKLAVNDYAIEKAMIKEHIAAKDYDKALDLLQPLLEKNIDFHKLYHEILQKTGQTKKMLEHARWYLNALLEKRRYSEAARLYQGWYKLDQAIQPGHLQGVYFLVSQLKTQHAYQEAVHIGFYFCQQQREHPKRIETCFLTAQILYENIKDKDKAMEIINFLINNFSDHVIYQDIVVYKNAVEAGHI